MYSFWLCFKPPASSSLPSKATFTFSLLSFNDHFHFPACYSDNTDGQEGGWLSNRGVIVGSWVHCNCQLGPTKGTTELPKDHFLSSPKSPITWTNCFLEKSRSLTLQEKLCPLVPACFKIISKIDFDKPIMGVRESRLSAIFTNCNQFLISIRFCDDGLIAYRLICKEVWENSRCKELWVGPFIAVISSVLGATIIIVIVLFDTTIILYCHQYHHNNINLVIMIIIIPVVIISSSPPWSPANVP